MKSRVGVGDTVQTPLGKGVVREVRTGGRLLVAVKNRTIVVDEGSAAVLAGHPSGAAAPTRVADPHSPSGERGAVARPLDLHGLTVDEALARVERALSDALLADAPELRIVHGRSGGRIRRALHLRLRELPGVRSFHVDPRNAGVTVVEL